MINKKRIKYDIGLGLIGCLIMGTQLLAHARSMMWERYIIPFVIGYAILFVLVGYHMLSEDALLGRVCTRVLAAIVLRQQYGKYAVIIRQ